MRKFSLQLHLWVGLFAAIFLFIEGVTGSIIAWGPEVFRMLNPAGPPVAAPVYRVPSVGDPLRLTELVSVLEKSHRGFRLRTVQFPEAADRAWVAALQSPTLASVTVWFDPHTGEALGERAQPTRFEGLVRFVQFAGKFHGNIVGGVALFFLSLSGLILWWPLKIFGPGRPVSFARANFNLHGSIGFYSSLFLLLFSGTAMVMASSRPAIALLGHILPTPPPRPPAKPAGPKANPANANRGKRNSVRLDFDQMRQIVAESRPGIRFTEMRVTNDGGGVVIFTYRMPGPAPSPTTMVVVNPQNGRIQELADPKDATLPEKIVRVWVRQIHTGEIYGRPTRWIAGFFSFMLALLAVTGPAIWWNRRRGNAAAPAGAP